MRITTIGKTGNSLMSTIPPEILRALGAHAGHYLVWTWNTKGHAEIRRLGQPHELAALQQPRNKPLQPRRRRRET